MNGNNHDSRGMEETGESRKRVEQEARSKEESKPNERDMDENEFQRGRR